MTISMRSLMLTTNEIQRTIQQAFPLCEVHVSSVGDGDACCIHFDIWVRESVYIRGSWERIQAHTQYFPHLPVPTTLSFLYTEIRQLREILSHVIAEQAQLDVADLELMYKTLDKGIKTNVSI